MTDDLPEPTAPGAVARVTTTLSKYPEVWVSSYINIGRWYPDTDSWLAGHVRGPLDDGGAHWEHLVSRGAVALLTDDGHEPYAAGWRAACDSVSQLADAMADDAPTPSDDGGEHRG